MGVLILIFGYTFRVERFIAIPVPSARHFDGLLGCMFNLYMAKGD
jgi:hypothetical protein